MNRFSISARPAIFTGLATALALSIGFACPASAQRQDADEDLKPIASGPGIQVCEPVAPDGNIALTEFGAGCGQWLQWSMGFHPELGQTPRWESAVRASKELHAARLRLTLAQANRLVSILGVTHIAVGKITGAPAKCLLTYQLYNASTQKAIGLPIKLTGSETQVIAQLPQAARTLLAGLGVTKPHVPASVGATPAELTEIGHYNWYAPASQTETDQPQMDALSKKLPLATLLSFVHHNVGTNQDKYTAARRLIGQASGNFLMLGAVAVAIGHAPDDFARSVAAQMTPPGGANNALLTYWAIARATTVEEGLQATLRLVQLSPRSASAWNLLTQKYADFAQSIRLGRPSSKLSGLERQKLQGLYFRGAAAATQATELDPEFADAWFNLSSAAAFANDRERADTAFWKALDLEPGNTRFYDWGLEMFQPKWYGDRESLAKVARMATTAVFPPNADLYTLGLELQAAKFPEEAKTLFARAIAQSREQVRQRPKDSNAHLMLGYALKEQEQYPEAETELKTAIQLDPAIAGNYYQLSQVYSQQKKYPEAAAQLREYIRRTDDPSEKRNLATLLLYNMNTDQLDEPEKLLREVIKAQPNWSQPHADLAFILTKKKAYDAALAEYTVVSRLMPGESSFHREMGVIYRIQAKYDDAIREGEMARALEPKNYLGLNALAESYAAAGDTDTSIKTYQQSCAAAAGMGVSHLALSRVYLKVGKKAEARAELESALKLYLSPEEKQTVQDLLDKNP